MLRRYYIRVPNDKIVVCQNNHINELSAFQWPYQRILHQEGVCLCVCVCVCVCVYGGEHCLFPLSFSITIKNVNSTSWPKDFTTDYCCNVVPSISWHWFRFHIQLQKCVLLKHSHFWKVGIGPFSQIWQINSRIKHTNTPQCIYVSVVHAYASRYSVHTIGTNLSDPTDVPSVQPTSHSTLVKCMTVTLTG